MESKFYITTTIPYVNAQPHIGFALELVQTDVIARYHRLLGEEVAFNMGTDEHGVKIYQKAIELGKDPQQYVDEMTESFKKILKTLNISNTHYVRTTDPHHKKAAQEFWNRCFASGDIYKAKYKIKYCIGCELEKTDSELENGRCILHPNLTIEEREEENYFFKFSKYQKLLLKLYNNNPDFVLPNFRLNEIKRFVEDGLQDFSVSRLKSKMPWGVPVPDDPDQVMYVWFDALVNYISTLGWPEDEKTFSDFWPGTQTAGKDNLRQQSAIWQAMLLSAGLPNSKQILIHGFITAEGQKMSKSLGNVIDPFKVVEKYGVDVVRYYLLREIPSYEDGDFSYKKLEERYNGDLANGLGNLVQRIATLIDSNLDGELIFKEELIDKEVRDKMRENFKSYRKNIDEFKLHEALGNVWEIVNYANVYVDDKKPWKLKDRPDEFLKVMTNLTLMVTTTSWDLYPFMPETADKIFEIMGMEERMDAPLNNAKLRIKKGGGLFPRLS